MTQSDVTGSHFICWAGQLLPRIAMAPPVSAYRWLGPAVVAWPRRARWRPRAKSACEVTGWCPVLHCTTSATNQWRLETPLF